jgi:hypothetical protein
MFPAAAGVVSVLGQPIHLKGQSAQAGTTPRNLLLLALTSFLAFCWFNLN